MAFGLSFQRNSSHDRLHHDGLGLFLQSEEMNELFDVDEQLHFKQML